MCCYAFIVWMSDMSKTSKLTLVWSSIGGPHIYFRFPSVAGRSQCLEKDPRTKASPYTLRLHAWAESSLAPMTLWRAEGQLRRLSDWYRHWAACSAEQVGLRYSMISHVQVWLFMHPAGTVPCFAAPTTALLGSSPVQPPRCRGTGRFDRRFRCRDVFL